MFSPFNVCTVAKSKRPRDAKICFKCYGKNQGRRGVRVECGYRDASTPKIVLHWERSKHDMNDENIETDRQTDKLRCNWHSQTDRKTDLVLLKIQQTHMYTNTNKQIIRQTYTDQKTDDIYDLLLNKRRKVEGRRRRGTAPELGARWSASPAI